MLSIVPDDLPPSALLRAYSATGYTDCYSTDIPAAISHSQYVEAFYTTALFKAERLILKWVVSKPSTDAQARQLAQGTADSFAAWYVEGRSENQLLLSDYRGQTRSWLMVAPGQRPGTTRLYFGSAVVPKKPRDGASRGEIGSTFSVLLGFHRLYSRALLSAAKSRLMASRGAHSQSKQ